MTRSCETCDLRKEIEKLDYSNGGCTHSIPEGYICLAFANEGVASWIVGHPAYDGMCECYVPKTTIQDKENDRV